jgi:hypothetical protein
VLNFYIKSLNPKGHIEACSFISYFLAEIISAEICEPKGDFYGIFHINGSEDLFDILSGFTTDIILEIPPGKSIGKIN